MYVVNLKHVCGHRQEHVLPGTWRTSAPYGVALMALVCPRCMARQTALRQAREIVSEYHRELCSKQSPPVGRDFWHPLKPAA